MSLFNIFRSMTSLSDGGCLKEKADRHSHILFGVDDGVASLEEALKVLELEEKAGFTDVWCTPHVMEDMPNTTQGLKECFTELQQAYKGNLRLHLAAEYMLDSLFEERLKEGDLLTMEDSTILIETSTWNPPPAFFETLNRILSAGYRPLLAHPERYRYLNEQDYETLQRSGVRFQLNLASIVGNYGESTRKKARYILKNGWYSAIGTDCHRLHSLTEQLNTRIPYETIPQIKQIHG